MSKGAVCRDCDRCTGNAFTGGARKMARGSVDVMTLGVTALARRKCKGCGHPMADHEGQRAEVVAQAAGSGPVQQPVIQAPPSVPAGWRPDPTDARALCWWDGQRWHPETKHYPET